MRPGQEYEHAMAQRSLEQSKGSLLKPILFSIGTISLSWIAAEYYHYNKHDLHKKWVTFKRDYFGIEPPKTRYIKAKRGDVVSETLDGFKKIFSDPIRGTVNQIIAFNVSIFGLWHMVPNLRFMYKYFTHSYATGQSVTLLTCAFSHQSLWHIAANMLAFHSFGPVARNIVGRDYFFPTIITGAITGSLCQHLFHYGGSRVPMLGASGFVITLVTLTALEYPESKMLLFFVVPVKMIHGLYGLAIFDIIGLTGIYTRMFGFHLGHAAHLGGLLAGVGIHQLLQRKNRRALENSLPKEVTKTYHSMYNKIIFGK